MSELAWRRPETAALAPVFRMLASAYGERDRGAAPGAAHFARYTECDPYHREGLWLVGELEGRPVTALRIAPREIVLPGGRRAKVGGIANVGTDPACAGRGHASRLLERAAAVMRAERFEHGLLYTSTPAFYRRLGWADARPAKRTLRAPGPLFEPGAPAEEASPDIAEAGKPHWPGLCALYERTVAEVPGALVRDAAYWRRWIGSLALPLRGARCLVALRGGEVAAYLAGRFAPAPSDGTDAPGPATLEAIEGAAAPGEEALLRPLARALAPGARAAAWPALPALDRLFGGLPGDRGALSREGAMRLRLDPGAEALPEEFLLTALDMF